MTTAPAPDSPDVATLRARIAAAPADPQARYDLGAALFQAGDAAAAAPAFLKASRIAPQWVAPRLMLAKCLSKMDRGPEALSILRQTTADFPDALEAWTQRGSLERQQGALTEAEASFRRVVAAAPNDAIALNNLGVVLRAQGRLAEAVETYRLALQHAPETGVAHANLGNALDALGHAGEAEAHLRAAVALNPASMDARYNLAIHLTRAEKPADALPVLRQIVAIDPAHWQAWINLGVALLAVGDAPGAEQTYRTALKLHPSAPEAHYNLAWVLLLTGHWREGWVEYEWRWQLPNFSSIKRIHATPAWDGAPRPDATLLIHAEQGLGDTIQFVRFVAAARGRCGRVILECPASLEPLLRDVRGVDDIVPLGRPLPPHDVHCHLLSLPHLFAVTPETVPHAGGYLSAPASHVLPPSTRRRIGVVWAGSADNKIDRRRSCEARHFAELLAGMDVDIVNLQAGPRAGELAPSPNLVFAIDGHVRHWTDTAAIVGQLDLIIGVDTAVMHLAGALGRPAWLLLPFSPDFRWLLGRSDTPWYKSVRLFRQPARGDWAGLFGNVRTALTVWLQSPA